jgi:hypothetical protein
VNTRTALVSSLKSYGLPALSQLLIVLVLALPAVQWLATSESIWIVPIERMPKGQVVYLLAKLAGLYAIAIFGLQLAYGLAGARVRPMLGQERGVHFHRSLGLVTLTLLLAHATLFIVGASMRIGHFAVQFALPDLFGDYYLSRIALGWWAGLAIIIGAVAALLRGLLGRWWKLAHWLSLPAAPALAIHSLSIGTESRMPVMMAAYLCMAALLVIAAFLRMSTARVAATPHI